MKKTSCVSLKGHRLVRERDLDTMHSNKNQAVIRILKEVFKRRVLAVREWGRGRRVLDG